MSDQRPEIITQLSEAIEIFDKTGKHDNESVGVQTLLGFFYHNKFLTESQVAFAEKLIKRSQQMRER